MIKALFVLNLKALATNFVKVGKKKTGTGKILLVVFIAAYVVVTFISAFATLFNSLLESFFSVGIGWLYFAFLALMVFSLCVIGTIFTASAQLFGAKDNELLLSMPIKPSAILISRLLVVLALDYLFAVIVAVPAFVIWVKGGYATVTGTAFFIMGILLLPLMAMVVSLLLAWLVGVVTSRIRHKNVITLMISVGFLLAYFYASSNIQKYLSELLSKGEQFAEAFRQAIPPFYAFGISVLDESVSHGIIFASWAILPFAALVILLLTNYKKILITNRGSVKATYKEKTSKAGNALSALVRKELAHYWSKPFVILNSSIGALCMLAVSVILLVKKSDIILYVNDLSPALGNLSSTTLVAIILAFLNSANNISASLISLEGKNLWIAKSIPVSSKVVIQSKVCTHLLISGLPCLIASVCTAITFAGSIADWMIIMLLPQTVGMLIAVGGIAINLHFPKLEWTNEIYVVKQGLSSMITMFGAMGLIAGLGFAYAFLLDEIVSFTVFVWLCAAIFAISTTAIYAWLIKSGSERLTKL